MPSLEMHSSSKITKMLLIGDSGSGKTGSFASLADAGYNLRIIDLDNGIDILRHMLMDPKTPYSKDAHKNVKFVTITERPGNINAVGGMAVPKSATVWNRIAQTLTHWKVGDEDLGPIATWGPKDILILDSMTLIGAAAFNFAAVQNLGNKNQDGRINYFHAQNYLEYLIQNLYGDDIKCNVIITSHISFIGDDDNTMHGYPTTVGRALSSKVGRYFNTILMIKSERDGSRRIYTIPTSRVELKNTAPLKVKPYYDIKFGLAEYFRDAQGTA
jgi:hypothetical protein